MSTFHARSAMIELFPWISIWFGENTVSNSLKIVRVNALISFLTRQTENVRRLATDLVAEAKRIETPWIKITTASIVFLGAKTSGLKLRGSRLQQRQLYFLVQKTRLGRLKRLKAATDLVAACPTRQIENVGSSSSVRLRCRIEITL